MPQRGLKTPFLRVLCRLLLVSVLFAIPLAGQTSLDDPYSLQFVRNNLDTALKMPGASLGSVTKDFQRLGDGVSIALIKILSQTDLKDPRTVRAFLPLIRQSFSYLPIVSVPANREPRVTSLLLEYLRQNVDDAESQREIDTTAQYVVHQSSSTQ